MIKIDNNVESCNDKKRNFTDKGKFAKGNQVAKGNKSVKIDKEALLEAMKRVETAKDNQPFLDRAFEMAYEYPQVMNKILDKFFADLSITDLRNASGMPFNLFITQFIEKKLENDEKQINEIP